MVTAALGLCVVVSTGSCLGQTSDPVPEWPLDDLLIDSAALEAVYEGDEVPPEGELVGEGALTIGQALVGDNARLRVPLREGLETANRMIKPGLLILNKIARDHEPVEVTDLRISWEVERKGTKHTLVIDRDALRADQFNYRLTVEPVSGDDVLPRDLVRGFFRPGPRLPDGRQTGEGLLRYEYDAFAVLPEYGVDVRGVGAIAFKLDDQGRRFNILLDDFVSPRGQSFSSTYQYEVGSDRAGQFCFQIQSDLIDRFDGDEVLTGAAAWNSNLSAKARAHLEIAETNGVFVDECWDGAGKQVWIEWDPELDFEPSDGAESSCEGRLAELELELCEFTFVPGEDPSVPQ